MSYAFGDGTRWRIHKGGGEDPKWIIRPPYLMYLTWTRVRWQFATYEDACAAFAAGHTHRPPVVYPTNAYC